MSTARGPASDCKCDKADVRVGIVGAGKIAEVHARILKMLPGIDLVSVADIDYIKAVDFQQRFGLSAAFDSVRSMARYGVEAVHVLTPPPSHAGLVIESLEMGLHVFVEKPLAISEAECNEVGRVAQTANRVIGVNHNVTFTPCYQKLLEAIRACRLGKVEHAAVFYNLPLIQLAAGEVSHWMFQKPRNILFELGPHPLSTIQRLIGGVQSANTTVSGEHVFNGSRFYDTWRSSLVCDRGTAEVYLSIGRKYPDGRLYVVGQDGVAWVDLFRNTITISTKSRFSPPVDDLQMAITSGLNLARTGVQNFLVFVNGFFASAVGADPYFLGMLGSVRTYYKQLREGQPLEVGLSEGGMVVKGCEVISSSGPAFPPSCN